MNKTTEIFETHRPGLFRLAYGMLGRIAPAEDAVQETFIRWQKLDIEQIRSPKKFLTTIVSRICLDEIKSAKSRKEQYIGPNLPEPFLTAENETPEEKMELTESLSMAMLVVLDNLTPVQRAVFILREVFDYDYTSISEIINKSESHCRKIAQRARESVREKKPSLKKNTTKQKVFVTSFIKALQNGELAELKNMLAKEAILYSDGGGKVAAAPKPIAGAAKIAKFLTSLRRKLTQSLRMEFAEINGGPSIIFYLDGQLYNVWSFYIDNDKIQNIYVVLNPEKLEHIRSKR
jgi:RNA polymerase sigma-70 factor (ECF subfamily)